MPSLRAGRVLLAIVLLSVLVSPLRRELYVGDETKYAQVVREMRAGGSWFLPTLEGSPFTHKPPVHFWFMASLTYLFGMYSVWSFVLPSILAFALLLWLMWKWGGPVAAFVCGSSLMIWGSAQTARMDVSFTALIALAAFFLERFFDRDDFRAFLWAAIALGVAVIIKGPMAPVIGLALFAFEWIRRRRVPRGNYFPAVAALIVIPLLWVVPALLIGGEAFANEILYKQTVRRAVGAWVHKSPPWFYLTHAPATLFPWFFLLIGALLRHRWNFLVSWILAVLVPYSLMSSKLDVYMMAMLPPVALLVARFVETEATWGKRANAIVLALLAIIGIAAFAIGPNYVKEPDRALALLPEVRALFLVLAAAAAIGFVIAIRGSLRASTYVLGFVPVAALLYVVVFLTPIANEMASGRPLIEALKKQNVRGDQIALHACPHLWSRDMPRELENVRYVDAETADASPVVIATSRRYADAIAPTLRGYKKVDELRLIGKWFDVYRR